MHSAHIREHIQDRVSLNQGVVMIGQHTPAVDEGAPLLQNLEQRFGETLHPRGIPPDIEPMLETCRREVIAPALAGAVWRAMPGQSSRLAPGQQLNALFGS